MSYLNWTNVTLKRPLRCSIITLRTVVRFYTFMNMLLGNKYMFLTDFFLNWSHWYGHSFFGFFWSKEVYFSYWKLYYTDCIHMVFHLYEIDCSINWLWLHVSTWFFCMHSPIDPCCALGYRKFGLYNYFSTNDQKSCLI